MGGTENKSESSYELSMNHPRFESFKVVTTEGRRSMETYMGVDEKDFMKWKKELQSKHLHSSQFLLIPHQYEFTSNDMCGSNGVVKLNYPEYPHLLVTEMEQRVGSRNYFTEQELWYLMLGLACAKANMKPAFSKVGDIRPYNIFINDHGKLKVSNMYSWPKENTNYGKFFDQQPTYLAPEEVSQLGNGLHESNTNQQSEMFSIGLTLLSAGLLEDFSYLYNTNDYRIDMSTLREKMEKFRSFSKYSEILRGTIINLCDLAPGKRLSGQELWEFLYPHSESIRMRESFIINNAPMKIRQTISHMMNNISVVHETLPIQYSSHAVYRPNPNIMTSRITHLDNNTTTSQINTIPLTDVRNQMRKSRSRGKMHFPPHTVRNSFPHSNPQMSMMENSNHSYKSNYSSNYSNYSNNNSYNNYNNNYNSRVGRRSGSPRRYSPRQG